MKRQPFTHRLLMTSEGRPFLSRLLCDLSGQDDRAATARSIWDGVDCPRCLAAGQESVDAILSLPDAALIALGAWHEGMEPRP